MYFPQRIPSETDSVTDAHVDAHVHAYAEDDEIDPLVTVEKWSPPLDGEWDSIAAPWEPLEQQAQSAGATFEQSSSRSMDDHLGASTQPER